MTDQHPITPPTELVRQWATEFYGAVVLAPGEAMIAIATQAAQWGADQELEACLCEVSFLNSRALADRVRSARRPKPPSLKERALAKLPEQPENMASHLKLTPGDVATIRRALEQLPDDQG